MQLPRPVEVLRDGTWRPGTLRAVRREPDGRWRGLATYRAADPLQQHYCWHSEDELRPRD